MKRGEKQTVGCKKEVEKEKKQIMRKDRLKGGKRQRDEVRQID